MDEETSIWKHPARSVRWGPWKAEPAPDSQTRRLKLLLLHGFAGSPAELRPFGQAAVNRGFKVSAPLLPGHGENLEAMRDCRRTDWTEAVVHTYESLRRDDSPVAIVGFCLGGALALNLAGQLRPRVVCCLATPCEALDDVSFPQEMFDGEPVRSVLASLRDSPSPEVVRWRMKACHHSVPESFFQEYQLLIEELGLGLKGVNCPLLVAQSRNDRITHPENAQKIIDATSSARQKLVWSRQAGHALMIDNGRRALFREILNFLEEEDHSHRLDV